MSRRPTAAAVALCAGVALAVPALVSSTTASAAPAAAAGSCPAPAQLEFAEPIYVDTTRAGGEPLVFTDPSGRLMYSSHAGSTHFYTPQAANPGSGAFVENYQGQTYIWTSDDDGKTWEFRPRILPTQGVANSGFSDPEFAFDSAGNQFFSEINLANIAFSKSTDKGSTWTLQNVVGAVLTDRQWMEADREDELYFVANAFGGGTGVPPGNNLGHFISKSTDGGKTFTTGVANPGGLGDIRVDKRTGTVYEANYSGGVLGVKAFRNARDGDLTGEVGVVAEGVQLVSSFAALDLDPAGNVYITWDERREGDREPGIWFASSKDGARTFSDPVRVDDGSGTAIWPWIAVGDEGRAAIAWLQADTQLPDNDAETPGDHGWRIAVGATTTGLGCPGGRAPSFTQDLATVEPVHRGTICQSGTTCQGTLTDRRLGDYISLDIDSKGFAYVGYSDTRIPAAVSLPGFVRQSGGPSMLAPKTAPGRTPTATTGQPAAAVQPGSTPQPAGGQLPATGAAALLPLSGALVLLGLGLAVRRRRAA